MKINFFKIKKDFKKKNLELNPKLYWKLMVIFSFVLSLVAFIFGYYVFTQVKVDVNSINENIHRRQLIDKERLEKALMYFSLRQQKSFEIINSTDPIVDPSL